MNEAQQAALEALRQRFLSRSADDLARLRAHVGGTPLTGPDMRVLVHRLAGAAGTFGCPELGAVAGELDDAMLERPLTRDEIERLIASLQALAALGASG